MMIYIPTSCQNLFIFFKLFKSRWKYDKINLSKNLNMIKYLASILYNTFHCGCHLYLANILLLIYWYWEL